MSSCPSLYKNTNIRNDCCEVKFLNQSNKKMSDRTFDIRPNCSQQALLCQPGVFEERPCNLAPVNPYNELVDGSDGFVLTHTGNKRQLMVRPYRTVPLMTSCQVPLMEADSYSRLSNGEATRTKKSGGITETRADDFMPMIPCLKQNIQDPVHYVPEFWPRGGMDTRSYIRNADYLRACGIRKPQSSCDKFFCGVQRIPYDMALKKGQTYNLPCMPNSCTL